MAGRSTTLTVKIVSDASKASQGFADAEKKVGGFQRGLDKASVASAGVLAGIAAVGKKSFDAASALQQSGGAIETVFGKQAAAVEKYGKTAAKSMGLSQRAYQEGAALIGSQLKSLGFGLDDAVVKQNDLQQQAADLAATFGGSTADAVGALSSALKGERDPIERYGVSITEAGVKAKIAALGLDVSTDAAKRHAGAVATMAIIQDQTSATTGTFARELDTAAGSQALATAQFENAAAQLGEVLLPIVSAAMGLFTQLTGVLTAHKTATQLVVAVVGGLALGVLAVNGAVRAYRAMVAVAAAAQWVWNAAISANPIMLVVLAIAAIVTAVVLAYNKFSWFRGIVDAIGSALKWAFEGAKAGIAWILDKLSFIKSAASWVGGLFSSPLAVTVSGDPDAPAAVGLYGAAAGAPAPIRGAALGSLTGGTSPSAGQGPTGGTTVVNVTVNGALDPVAVGRQIESVLAKYQQATGRRSTVALGRGA